ncbi:MAG: Dabb family protein [Clostridia bacterium]|nr:Dabb family protein [Clostridia bacterium]
MIKHVVMWKFKEENKAENLKKAKEMLLALPAIIGELKKMEVYFDITGSDMSMDMMLDTEFLSVEDMKTYAVHPEHLKVSAFIRSVIESRVVLDSEI